MPAGSINFIMSHFHVSTWAKLPHRAGISRRITVLGFPQQAQSSQRWAVGQRGDKAFVSKRTSWKTRVVKMCKL